MKLIASFLTISLAQAFIPSSLTVRNMAATQLAMSSEQDGQVLNKYSRYV